MRRFLFHAGQVVVAVLILLSFALAAVSGMTLLVGFGLALIAFVLGLIHRVIATRSLKGFRGERRPWFVAHRGLLWSLSAIYAVVGILPIDDDPLNYVLLALFVGARLALEWFDPPQTPWWGLELGLGSLTAFFLFELATHRIPHADPLVLSSPMQGEVYVFNGGPAGLVNHHWYVPGQRHALDIVLAVDGEDHTGDGTELTDHHCFGAPIYAPADGTVVSVLDGRPDMPIGQMDAEVIVGNNVVLQIGPDRYALFAHLKQGTVAVAEGDTVTCGQVLGECGNSGNTSQPHLHYQVQEHADLWTFPTTFPLAFHGYDGLLIRGSKPQLAPECD